MKYTSPIQYLRKITMSGSEARLVELAEGAENIIRNGSRYDDEYIYKITLQCSTMEVDTRDNTVLMTCGKNVTSSVITDRFIAAIAYLHKNDYARRTAIKINESERALAENVNKFIDCATNCGEKK